MSTASILRSFLILESLLSLAEFRVRADARGNSTLSKFIWISDLHFDPFYGQENANIWENSRCDGSVSTISPRGQVGCDSPLNLIRMAVLSSKDILQNPDFVLVTGDFSRHGMGQLDNPEDNLGSILSTVSQVLENSFAKSLIVPVLGNNDMIPDYYLNTTETNITLLNIAADSLHLPSAKEDSTLRFGGYFSRDIGGKITVLSLNTVIYSTSHQPEDESDDPLGQFEWMKHQLIRAKSENIKVIIAGHIPPTIGSYRKAQFWQDRYLVQYLTLVEQYSKTVSAQLFGHLHSDEFRVFPDHFSDEVPPLLLTSSLTPIYGNNPSLRVVTYDTELGSVVDYVTYFFDLDEDSTSRWQKLYSFREAYGVDNMTAPTMRSIVDAIGSSREILDKFVSYQRVNAKQPLCDSRCQAEWVCTLRSASRKEYDDCAGAHRWTRRTEAVILAVAAAGLLGLFALGWMCLFSYRRRTLKYRDIDAYAFNIDTDEGDDVSL